MTSADRSKPAPTAPGYGDQGPAGGGRDLPDRKKAAGDRDEPGADVGKRL